MHKLASLDYLVLVFYLGSLIGLGLFMMRRQKTTADYFIANKRIPGWAMGFALMSTLVSNMTFLANPGVAFASDWRQFTHQLVVPFIMIPIAFIFVPFYRKHIGMSLYEYFEGRFGYGIRAYGAVAFILYYIARMAFIFYVLSMAVSVMTGWNIFYVILFLGFLTIIYTLMGGIEAVIWTDVIQGFLLILGGFLCLGIAFFEPPGGPGEIVKMAWEAKKFGLGEVSFNLQRDSIFVMILYGLYQQTHNFSTDQTMIQRYLTAKSDDGAKRNAFIFGAACVPVWWMFFLIGTGIWGFYQLTTYSIPAEIASKTDQIFPYFIMTQLPIGVTGLVLAALLASAMSTLDSGLNSVATVFVNDLFSKIKPRTSDKTKLFTGRLIVVIIGLFSLAIAVWLTFSKEHALVLYFTALSILAGGILGLFLLGFLTKTANFKGAVTGIIASILVVTWATMTKNNIIDLGKWNYDLHPYLIGFWSHVTVFAVGYFTSFLFKRGYNE